MARFAPARFALAKFALTLAALVLAGIAVIAPQPAVAAPPTTAAAAPPPSLDLPIDCIPGKTCWVAKFVDLDPGPGVLDYACTARANDGHKGTDIAVRDLEAMREGVAVLAAAPGVVRGTRDGMQDISVRKLGRAALGGKDCGNGVAIDHGGGWTTQYCHMRKGSIIVRTGDKVKAGQKLGLVGLSGNSEFPHVHLGLRNGKRTVDPFVGLAKRPLDGSVCGVGKAPLWSPATLAALTYTPAAIYNVGFAEAPPKIEALRAGRYRSLKLSTNAPTLIFWADIFGVEAGDKLDMRVTAPDGTVLVDHRKVLKARKARWFQYIGKKRPGGGAWPAGRYRGEITLSRTTRGRTVYTTVTREAELR